jgi:Tol biopolymer transport system component
MATLVLPALVHGQALGLFEGHADVGTVSRPGTVAYDTARQLYTISGSGANMWNGHDDFHLVWKRMRGDFMLTARAEFEGEGVDPHRKLGWMIRSSLDANSQHVSVAVHGDGLVSLQFRRTAGGTTEEVQSPVNGADVIQLERTGGRYIMSVARFGDAFTAEQVDVVLGDEVYIGLFVCAHNNTVVEQATFRDVRITTPARADFVPYRDYIGSNLEVLDVANGARRIVHSSPESLQAPNWTTDGKALIYNSNGLLYRFDLASGQPTRVNTGFATANNNDHVLSFDGRMLAISHHSTQDGNASIIYTLPATGGTPRKVTPRGPSYLHGWSPDGKFLVYTGGRNDEYDIYRIPVEGGEEVQLTRFEGLDDGPEYAPDGRHIYFNSVRSGTMQIWRMGADGSNPEQVTNDEYNNWFPHISPDGNTLVFLSYMKDVDPSDHPWYRQVYIRTMPVSGGAPRVLAYVYGGQGTINVPSWSPDGRQVAFVSNTTMR